MKTAETIESIPMPTKRRGWLRLFHATGNSLEGFGAAFLHEAAFRMEVALGSILMLTALMLPVSWTATALLFAAVLQVWIVELLNSGLEWVVDYISLERHPFAKRAKDMASAAVFCSLVLCGIIWAAVLADSWPLWGVTG